MTYNYQLILQRIIKTLAIYCLLILTVNNCFANQLPQLPNLEEADSSQVTTSTGQAEDRSWWQRFKGIFGFGEDDKKQQKDQSKTTEAQAKTQETRQAHALPEIPAFDNAANETKMADNTQPKGDALNSKTLNNSTLTNNDLKTEELNIDELFEKFNEENLNQDFSTTSNTNDMKSEAMQEPEAMKEQIMPVASSAENSKIAEEAIDAKSATKNETAMQTLEAKQTEFPSIPDVPTYEDQKLYTENNLSSASDPSEEDKLLPSADPINKNDQQNRVLSFREQIKQKLDSSKTLPQLPIASSDSKTVDDNLYMKQDISSKQLRFVNNETQVLKLPNDDIVLGKLTEEARIENMPFHDYVDMFWKNYYMTKADDKRQSIEQFISKYDDNFNTEKFLYSTDTNYTILSQANKAIAQDKYYDLKVLLDNYSILQLSSTGGNNMLHNASYHDNYPATKLLLMRGINIKTINSRGETALLIAKKYNNAQIAHLIKQAEKN